MSGGQVYLRPAGPGESELTEKRSRFLGHVRPAATEAEARDFIAAMKKQYHDARHNCWCYRIHGGPQRYSDDGEPQGSAGLPMLELLQRQGVEDAVCVVTRYFGGVLLGTGGLLRAYTQSARDALAAAGTERMGRFVRLALDCPYPLLERLKLELAAAGGSVESLDYAQQVSLTLLLPVESSEDFCRRVRELGGGSLEPRVLGETLRGGG